MQANKGYCEVCGPLLSSTVCMTELALSICLLELEFFSISRCLSLSTFLYAPEGWGPHCLWVRLQHVTLSLRESSTKSWWCDSCVSVIVVMPLAKSAVLTK